MAVVTLNTNEWSNSDGLMVLFGTDRARASRGGEFSTLIEGKHCVEATIALASLPTVASGNVQIISDNVNIPNGAIVEQVDLFVSKVMVNSGSGTLDIGLVDQDRSTEIDFDGLVSAIAKTALDGLGEYTKIVLGSTSVGALVGTKITNTGLLVAKASTSDFTAGVVRVRVWFTFPLAADV